MRMFKRDSPTSTPSYSHTNGSDTAPRSAPTSDPRAALAMALHGGGINGNGVSSNGGNGQNNSFENGKINGYNSDVGNARCSMKSKSDSKLGLLFHLNSSGGGEKKKNNQKVVRAPHEVMMYHWEKEGGGGKKSSADDMVLLTKINENAITDNLKKRFMEDKIYTYIGPVLVAVNPFKQLSCYGDKEIRLYQGAAQYEVPPHIYALADNMYRNMMIDGDSQCVIISGESGAGKTVSAKLIMNYMTQISGGGTRLQHVKDIILSSNPLLEAFGNAKTTRNNNSSRFGKYIEIQFSKGGEPLGGKVSNFLLEKSRVHSLSTGERNFHIFYQLCAGATSAMSELGIVNQPEYYHYLGQSDVSKVEGIDDAKEFKETLEAMTTMGLSESQQFDILRVVSAIMHLSNVTFEEQNNDAFVSDDSFLQYPAYLLGIEDEKLKEKLISRVMDSVWGGKTDRVEVTFNQEKAQFARDAWAKGLYARLFEYIVKVVNQAMATDAKDLNIGILDIYGFEIFQQNGFEQFCINYVNEKLQQIFIELTLKSEQEEYAAEGIEWTPIQFFNNAIVCELIESRRPVGIMCVLDDTCATMSAVSQGADDEFRNKMNAQVGSHAHYQPFKNGFTVKHYAGNVSYHTDGFCEKNRDVLNIDIIELMQTSDNAFIRSLFPEKVAEMKRGRPTTAGSKIKSQANQLVSTLTQCVPHYIRCIKPNETKKPKDWEQDMVKHQVEYLGLKENIKVKRAGFAYRRPFNKFLARYAILSRETWPSFAGRPIDGIHIIMKSANMDTTHYQIGKSKVFIKDPESLYMLEECRERKFDHYARVLQKAFKKHFSKRRQLSEKEAASRLVYGHKERRRYSLHRAFHGDYLAVPMKPGLQALTPRREKIFFALTVEKFDRQFRQQKRDLIVTNSTLLLVGREKVKQGPNKGTFMEVVKRRLNLQDIIEINLSKCQDDFMLFHVKDDYSSLLQVRLKTELLLVLHRAMDELGAKLNLKFSNNMNYTVRKTGWRGGTPRKVNFLLEGQTDEATLTVSGNTLTVKIARGMGANSRPSSAYVDNDIKSISKKYKTGELRSARGSRLVAPPSSNNHTQQKSNTNKFGSDMINHSGNGAIPGQNSKASRAMRVPRSNPNTSTPNIGGMRNVPPPPIEPAPPGQPNVTQNRMISKPPPPPVPKRPKVKAIYAYDARDIDELTFELDTVMDLINDDPSGWWTCELKGKVGYCPGNYLEKI